MHCPIMLLILSYVHRDFSHMPIIFQAGLLQLPAHFDNAESCQKARLWKERKEHHLLLHTAHFQYGFPLHFL